LTRELLGTGFLGFSFPPALPPGGKGKKSHRYDFFQLLCRTEQEVRQKGLGIEIKQKSDFKDYFDSMENWLWWALVLLR
jgi:hypothetical protein